MPAVGVGPALAALAPALGVLLLVLAAALAAQALRPPPLEPAPDLVDFFPLERNAPFAYQFARPEASLFCNRPLPPARWRDDGRPSLRPDARRTRA